MAKKDPALLKVETFVHALILRRRPGPEDDADHDPERRAANLDELWDVVKDLVPAFNTLRAHVLYHRLDFDRSRGVYDRARFDEYVKIPRHVSYAAPKYIEACSNDPAKRAGIVSLGRAFESVTGLATVFARVTWLAGPDGGDLPGLRHLPSFVKKYQRARVMAMFSTDPSVLRGAGFQQQQAEIAFGSGQFAGRGPLNIPVGMHVPEAHNDMIFALVGEQFGFLGAIVLLGGYLVLFAAGIEIAASTKEPFGRLVAVGIVSLFAGQTFLNLMVTLKLMPVTGVTLPFASPNVMPSQRTLETLHNSRMAGHPF